MCHHSLDVSGHPLLKSHTYSVALNFCGSLLYLQIGDFDVLRELMFAIGKDSVFLSGNFYDFLKVTFKLTFS